ncbi:C40 family peptidase [Streptomyces sp. NPDC051940]|uniref:C40 family peptidase n=1 Tax=Streptomyces sp. NPDC051940 TaxID=3155675 RepID=UPI003432A08E
MSLKTHIPSHRKPRRSSASIRALRTGVAGGALATLVATASPASAAEAEAPAETTAQLPVIPDVEAKVQEGVEALEQTALRTAVQAEATEAQDAALKAARKARKAEEAREAARRAAAKRAAEERASRAAARADLSSPTASGSVATLIGFLKAQVGKAYVMGGTGPSAYDCSGLTQTAFRQIGVSLPRTAAEQSTAGTQIAVSDVRPGDLVFWGGIGSAYHVAVYIGDGKYLDAANPSKGVVIQEMSYYMPTSAVRVL